MNFKMALLKHKFMSFCNIGGKVRLIDMGTNEQHSNADYSLISFTPQPKHRLWTFLSYWNHISAAETEIDPYSRNWSSSVVLLLLSVHSPLAQRHGGFGRFAGSSSVGQQQCGWQDDPKHNWEELVMIKSANKAQQVETISWCTTTFGHYEKLVRTRVKLP